MQIVRVTDLRRALSIPHYRRISETFADSAGMVLNLVGHHTLFRLRCPSWCRLRCRATRLAWPVPSQTPCCHCCSQGYGCCSVPRASPVGGISRFQFCRRSGCSSTVRRHMGSGTVACNSIHNSSTYTRPVCGPLQGTRLNRGSRIVHWDRRQERILSTLLPRPASTARKQCTGHRYRCPARFDTRHCLALE